MDVQKVKEIQDMIKRHQQAGQAQVSRPAGHNAGDEDLNKVALVERIGKAGESDLIK